MRLVQVFSGPRGKMPQGAVSPWIMYLFCSYASPFSYQGYLKFLNSNQKHNLKSLNNTGAEEEESHILLPKVFYMSLPFWRLLLYALKLNTCSFCMVDLCVLSEAVTVCNPSAEQGLPSTLQKEQDRASSSGWVGWQDGLSLDGYKTIFCPFTYNFKVLSSQKASSSLDFAVVRALDELCLGLL